MPATSDDKRGHDGQIANEADETFGNQAARGAPGIPSAPSGSGPNRFGPSVPLVTYQFGTSKAD